MTYARKTLVCLQDTPYYHVVAGCVRRGWRWGVMNTPERTIRCAGYAADYSRQ
jgi:hypothetical protein